MSRFQKALRIMGGAVAVAALAAGARFVTAPAYEGNAGWTREAAFAPVRSDEIRFDLWYPTAGGGRAITVGGNGVFHGVAAGKNAPIRAGQHPVVVLSHGAGGNAGQFGWIAAALAEQGYMVAIPNHPGSTSGNASAAEAVKIWTRPPDISAVLDALEDRADVDMSQVTAMGFSAGGYTAMAVAGARVAPDKLQGFCDDPAATGMSDCAFFARFGVNLHDIDMSPAGQDHRDPRINRLVVIDPGVVQTLTPDSLAAIDMPSLIINLDDPIPAAVDASDAAQLIPGAEYVRDTDATHFSFLAECKPKGPAILEREGELDPLCADAGGRDRAAIHAGLVEVITAFIAAAPDAS